MYYVLYRCNYREHWYEDYTPRGFNAAVAAAHQIAAARRTVARVVNDYGQIAYQCGG
jgi:hypothetical protein